MAALQAGQLPTLGCVAGILHILTFVPSRLVDSVPRTYHKTQTTQFFSNYQALGEWDLQTGERELSLSIIMIYISPTSRAPVGTARAQLL